MTIDVHAVSEMTKLRNRLNALSYTQEFDQTSAPLVTTLLDDLVQMSESHRLSRLQSDQHLQEITTFNCQLDVIKRENSRLIAENNELHVDIMKGVEKEQANEREHYQAIKSLECQIAELAYWKNCTMKRLKELEAENEGLRQKLQSLVQANETDQATIDMTRSLTTKQQEMPSTVADDEQNIIELDILQTADARITDLESKYMRCQKELETLTSENSRLMEVIELRDSEIVRLGKQLEQGPDMDKLQLHQKNETNESVILTLNQQIEYLSDQLAKHEEELKEKHKLEAAYKNTEQTRIQQEKELKKEMDKNAEITRQVQHLQRTLTAYTLKRTHRQQSITEERDQAMSQVVNLMGKLMDTKEGTRERDALIKAAEAGCQELAEEKENLENKICQVQQLLDDAVSKESALNSQIQDLSAEKSLLQDMADKQSSDLDACRARVLEMDQSYTALDRKFKENQAEIDALSSELENEQDHRASLETKHGLLQRKANDLEDENTKLHANCQRFRVHLESAEKEMETLRSKATTSHRSILDFERSLKMSRQSEDEALSAMALLKTKLEESNSTNEELTIATDQLKIEEARLQGTVASLESEKQFLTERLASETEKGKELQGKLQKSWLESAQSSKLAKQTEELYIKLKQLTDERSILEAKIADLNNANYTLKEDSEKLRRDCSELRSVVDDVQARNQELELSLSNENRLYSKAKNDLRKLQDENEKLKHDQAFSMEQTTELRVIREELDQRVRSLELECRDSKQANALLNGELQEQTTQIEKHHASLTEMSAELDNVRKDRDNVSTKLNETLIKLKQSDTQNDELLQRIDQIRIQFESSKSFADECERTNSNLRQELVEKSKEIDLLTALSLKGDATVQEYMRHLKHLSTTFKAEQLRVAQLEKRLQERDVEVSRTQEMLGELKTQLKQLAIEKDQQQDDLDVKAEGLISEQCRSKALQEKLDIATTTAQTHQRSLDNAKERVDELEHSLKCSVEGRDALEVELKNRNEELRSMTEEFRAVSDDLELMVRENQQLSDQLTSMQAETEKASEQQRIVEQRLNDLEQTLRVKETDLEDLRQAYEDVSNENRKLTNDLNELDRQSNDLESQSRQRDNQNAMLLKENEAAQARISQQLIDLQAYHRQVESLSRELSKKEDILNERGKQKTLLIDEMQCIERQRFQQENEIKDYTRKLAQSDSILQSHKDKIEDYDQEMAHLKSQLRFSHDKIKELETVIVDLRSRDFHKEMTQANQPRVSLLEERNQLLESQISALEDQLAYMEQARDFANEELSRKKAENQSLLSQLDTSLSDQQQASVSGSDRELESAEAESAKIVDALKHEIQSLENQRDDLRRDIDGSWSCSSEKIDRLEKQLEEERRRRTKAEKDFRRLVDITRDLASSPDNTATAEEQQQQHSIHRSKRK